METQFKTAQESFSADQILTGFDLDTPGYLLPRVELMNQSPAEFSQLLFESQPNPMEQHAESLLAANADIRNLSPALLPFLDGMTAPSTPGRDQSGASDWERIQAKFQKLPPEQFQRRLTAPTRRHNMSQMLARIQKSKRRGSTRAKTTPFEKIARGMQEF